MRLVYDLTANDIGSVAGRFAFAGGAVYCGTKFAVGAHHGRAAARGPGLRRARDGH
jgi:NADP-dependent 3-hydroxy acid dehydrogenase YdfG